MPAQRESNNQFFALAASDARAWFDRAIVPTQDSACERELAQKIGADPQPSFTARLAERYMRAWETDLAERMFAEQEATRWWLPGAGGWSGSRSVRNTITADGDFGRILIPEHRRMLIVPHSSWETRMTVNTDGRNMIQLSYPDGAEFNLRLWSGTTIYGLFLGGERNGTYISEADYRFVLSELQGGGYGRIAMRSPQSFSQMLRYRADPIETVAPTTFQYEGTAYELPSSARQDSHFIILRQI